MDFQYIQETYDELSKQLLNSSFVITATIHMLGSDVVHESTYKGMGDSLNALHTAPVQKNFDLDLPRTFRLNVFPMERTFTRQEGKPITHTLAGQFEPFDRWITCLWSAVSIRNDETYYDYADHVIMEGVRYKVKAVHKESFGIQPILHAFLVKESDE